MARIISISHRGCNHVQVEYIGNQSLEIFPLLPKYRAIPIKMARVAKTAIRIFLVTTDSNVDVPTKTNMMTDNIMTASAKSLFIFMIILVVLI